MCISGSVGFRVEGLVGFGLWADPVYHLSMGQNRTESGIGTKPGQQSTDVPLPAKPENFLKPLETHGRSFVSSPEPSRSLNPLL